MEEIEVGEYVRTEHGNIFKVSKTTDFGMNNVFPHDENGIMIVTQITKHSKNIIDLIEKDDYVNGHLVIDKCKEEVQEVEVESDYLIHHCLKEEDIKSIVTHESFNSIKYEVI